MADYFKKIDDVPDEHYILTGFGKFQGVDENPTMEIVKDLQNDTESFADLKLSYDIIDVSISGVASFHEKLLSHTDPKVLIHLGVNSSSSTFDLECYAYNNMTFRVPDEDGLTPNQQCIDESIIFDDKVCTDIPVCFLQKQLESEGFTVGLSHDPGRYICNYIYYKSMSMQLASTGYKMALFVHVPPFSVIPKSQQIAFVKKLIALLQSTRQQNITDPTGIPDGIQVVN